MCFAARPQEAISERKDMGPTEMLERVRGLFEVSSCAHTPPLQPLTSSPTMTVAMKTYLASNQYPMTESALLFAYLQVVASAPIGSRHSHATFRSLERCNVFSAFMSLMIKCTGKLATMPAEAWRRSAVRDDLPLVEKESRSHEDFRLPKRT